MEQDDIVDEEESEMYGTAEALNEMDTSQRDYLVQGREDPRAEVDEPINSVRFEFEAPKIEPLI